MHFTQLMSSLSDSVGSGLNASGRTPMRDRTALLESVQRAESLKRSNEDMRQRILQVWWRGRERRDERDER